MRPSKPTILTINLLPPDEKKELLLEFRKKLIIVLGTIAIVGLAYLVLVLLLLKFYILQEVLVQRNLRQDIEKQYHSTEEIILQKRIQDYNKSLDKIYAFYQQEKSISKALKDIVGISRPSGVLFETLAIENGDQVIKVSVSGASDTRENLLQFKRSLENHRLIQNVSFAPTSWIKPKNASFSLVFEVLDHESTE